MIGPHEPAVRSVTVLAPATWWRGLGALTRSGSPAEGLSWALYDFANTIYSYAIVSYAMGLWVVDRIGPQSGQFWFGVAFAVSVGLNALVSPVLGAVSDRAGRRLPFLFVFTALCIGGTAVIGFIPTGGLGAAFLGLIVFALANFAYQAALIYYDATLPAVSRSGSRGRMSGIGVAVGYLGTIFIALLILILGSEASGVTFLLAAAMFAIFSVPIFVFVREKPETAERISARQIADSWAQLATTIRHAREVPGLPRFLVGRFFYTDPVNTVIVVMSVFATQAIGMKAGEANLVLLSLTVAAVIASFVWGHLVERIGPKRTLMIVLGTWVLGLFIGGIYLSVPTFLLAGLLLGAALGGVWTSDRVFMLRLSPPDKVGEFFGLYGLAGKFSAVTGPLLYGAVLGLLLPSLGTAAYQVAIFSLLGLMSIGFMLLRGVPEPSLAAEEQGMAAIAREG
jgi:UMF1 family MFS transporter